MLRREEHQRRRWIFNAFHFSFVVRPKEKQQQQQKLSSAPTNTERRCVNGNVIWDAII